MMVGTLTRVTVPTGHLQELSQEVRDNDGFPDPNPGPDSDSTPSEGTVKGAKLRDSGVVPLKPGAQSPLAATATPAAAVDLHRDVRRRITQGH